MLKSKDINIYMYELTQKSYDAKSLSAIDAISQTEG